jgi:hypothetical protein
MRMQSFMILLILNMTLYADTDSHYTIIVVLTRKIVKMFLMLFR